MISHQHAGGLSFYINSINESSRPDHDQSLLFAVSARASSRRFPLIERAPKTTTEIEADSQPVRFLWLERNDAFSSLVELSTTVVFQHCDNDFLIH